MLVAVCPSVGLADVKLLLPPRIQSLPTMGACLRSPKAQVTIMGVVFLLIFTAYITIQAFAAKLYGSELGSNMELTLYAVFTAACFAAPAITNVCGPRLTLFCGSLGYAALVLTSLILALFGTHPWTEALVIFGGGCCGLGAALLWTAQGRMMMEWSNGSDQGEIFAIFWALFNLSAVFGGALTFFFFAEHPIEDQRSLVPLYVIFLCCIVGGGSCTGCLSPSARRRSVTHATTSALAPSSPQLDGSAAPAVPDVPTSMMAEAAATVRLFATPTMAILAPLMWYTGYNQPYQLNTFGDRFFSARALGLEIIVFYTAEIVGGFAAGWLLDRDPARPRAAAARQLVVFGVVTTAGYGIALSYELDAATRDWPMSDVAKLRVNQTEILPPTAAFALWGLSDSQVQAYAYWLMRQLFAEGPEQSRAVGFYKMVQSLGWCAGFALVPSARMPPIVQMALTFACALVGIALAFLRLPSDRVAKVGRAVRTRGDEPLLVSSEPPA